MKVQFWGVRGSTPCSSPDLLRYGGNTSCVSVQCDNSLLIFDAGSGIRDLGRWVQQTGFSRADLFLSHVHWDHILGLPFFAPLFESSFQLHIRAGNLKQAGHAIRDVLAVQMSAPFFPVTLDSFTAKVTYEDFVAGESIAISDQIDIQTAALSHPQGATGYRVNHCGKSVCYVTDTGHEPGTLDPVILRLIDRADLVIYDSTYTDAEFPQFASWGHSTWQQGVRLCQAAQAKQLMIFHHDPDHNDGFMDEVAREAQQLWAGAHVAQEGTTLTI